MKPQTELRAAEPIRKDDLGYSFSHRYINGYRTGYSSTIPKSAVRQRGSAAIRANLGLLVGFG
jgi:hypothetical protein